MAQGLAEHKLDSSEKQNFFGTTWKLAGKHARLPNSMIITDEIDFSASSQLQISGGFADIKPGMYKGGAVAVKTLRVDVADDFVKIRKVGGEFSVVRRSCTEVMFSNSVKRLSFGTRYLIPTFSSLSAFWAALNSINSPRSRSGWYTVILRSTSRKTPQTDWNWCVSPCPRTDISCIKPRQQLHGAAQGLKYIHDANLIHGDLKGVRT